ncbi:MAG: putative plasmid maintenance system antidote protein family [Candidatus Acidoferrum typicum]|nr:putative plasmid maintenance system antidote protein family [Candidatus Acidoferrum typicum]
MLVYFRKPSGTPMARRKLKPIHPGEILREEFMTPLGLSMNKMAMDLRVPVTRIADIVTRSAASPPKQLCASPAISRTARPSG